MEHPLQPIRDGIEQVYQKARAEKDDHLHRVALTAMAELATLCHKAGFPPTQGASNQERSKP